MTALVTGITGFVGSHLAEHLLARGDAVVGLSRGGVWPATLRGLADKVVLHRVEIGDSAGVRAVLRSAMPDAIYHLSGQANVPASFADPDGTWRTNFVGAKTLFESIVDVCPRARLLVVSTGQVHGQPSRHELPITERTPLRPINPYAVSKAAADLLALEFVGRHGLNATIARPFNHIGPRQDESYAVAHFAKQIAELERTTGPRVMHVGRLDVERDFTDVRDVVRAYPLLIDSGRPGEIFNVASGTTRSLRSLLDAMLAIGAARIEVEQTSDLLRPSDPDRIAVACERLRERTGWAPRVPIERTLADTLESWRGRLADA